MGQARHNLKWRVLEHSTVLECAPWLSLAVEKVETSAGRIVDDYYKLALPDFVVVYARTIHNKVIMLRQYKHGLGEVSLTLPGGMLENGEAAFQAAARELREETGYTSSTWHSLGSYTVNGNLGCGRGHFFFAEGVKPGDKLAHDDLEEMEVVLLEQCQVAKAVLDGEVGLLNHVTGITLASMFEAATGKQPA